VGCLAGRPWMVVRLASCSAFSRSYVNTNRNHRKAFDDGNWWIFLSNMGCVAPALSERTARGVQFGLASTVRFSRSCADERRQQEEKAMSKNYILLLNHLNEKPINSTTNTWKTTSFFIIQSTILRLSPYVIPHQRTPWLVLFQLWTLNWLGRLADNQLPWTRFG
jgi:hypothetical protein